jgi:hypothetical protein
MGSRPHAFQRHSVGKFALPREFEGERIEKVSGRSLDDVLEADQISRSHSLKTLACKGGASDTSPKSYKAVALF